MTFRTYSYRIYPGKGERQKIESLLDRADDAFDRLCKDAYPCASCSGDAELVHEYIKDYDFNNSVSHAAGEGIKKNAEKVLLKLADGKIDAIYPRNRKRTRRSVDVPLPSVNGKFAYISGIGKVEIVRHRPLPTGARIFRTTLKADACGAEYYLDYGIYFEAQKEEAAAPDPKKAIGLDYAQNGLYVDSEGRNGEYPGFAALGKEKEAEILEKLSRCHYGSGRWKKYTQRLKKLEKHIRNQREDWQYKRAKLLSESYDLICHEHLNFEEMKKENPLLSPKIVDNKWNDFRKKLEDKMQIRGKYLIEAPKYYPSSQICSACGYRAGKQPLDVRTFVCPSCGIEIDRDVNAAINLKNIGVELIAA